MKLLDVKISLHASQKQEFYKICRTLTMRYSLQYKRKMKINS